MLSNCPLFELRLKKNSPKKGPPNAGAPGGLTLTKREGCLVSYTYNIANYAEKSRPHWSKRRLSACIFISLFYVSTLPKVCVCASATACFFVYARSAFSYRLSLVSRRQLPTISQTNRQDAQLLFFIFNNFGQACLISGFDDQPSRSRFHVNPDTKYHSKVDTVGIL